MILSLLSFPLPLAVLYTIFGERGLPCPCVSLPPCPVSSRLSLFVLCGGGGGGRVVGVRVAVEKGLKWSGVDTPLSSSRACPTAFIASLVPLNVPG